MPNGNVWKSPSWATCSFPPPRCMGATELPHRVCRNRLSSRASKGGNEAEEEKTGEASLFSPAGLAWRSRVQAPLLCGTLQGPARPPARLGSRDPPGPHSFRKGVEGRAEDDRECGRGEGEGSRSRYLPGRGEGPIHVKEAENARRTPGGIGHCASTPLYSAAVTPQRRQGCDPPEASAHEGTN